MLSLITGPDANKGEESTKIKSWGNILLDSAAIGGIAAFSVWAGTAGSLDVLTAIKAFCLSFFIQIGYYRGLKKAVAA